MQNALKLLEQGLMPFLDHKVGNLIQELDDVVVQFFGGLPILLILLHHAHQALDGCIGRILGIFPERLNECLLAGYGDLVVKLVLFFEELVLLTALDPLADGDIGYSEDHRQFIGIGLAVQIGFPAVVPLDAELTAVTHTLGVPYALADRG